MVDFVVNGLIVAGVLCMIVVPLLACALVRACTRGRELAERNAAQGVAISLMEGKLRAAGAVPVLGPGASGELERDWRLPIDREAFESECG